MLRGLWGLIWLEIKIFLREPLGVVGTLGVPVLLFVLFGRQLGPGVRTAPPEAPRFISADLPVFIALLIAVSTALSLITIIAIYREGGILKRLRATPLRPSTILTAHVVVKLIFTAVALAVMILAGRRYYPVDHAAPLVSFALALLLSTVTLSSLGFLLASLVPTARFAQPLGAVILYPMLGLSGLFVAVDALPAPLEAVARVLPLTYAVSLLRGIWHGASWSSHLGDVGALVVMFVALTAASTRLFRWE